MTTPIYLDGQASTPLAPEAQSVLLEALSHTANPHSSHGAGRRAHEVIETARQSLADLIGAAPAEMIFTSGATEANNLAIQGLARAAAALSPRRVLLTTQIEHPSVQEPMKALEAEGFEVRYAAVGSDGRLDLGAFGAAVATGEVLLASVMAANNVTGLVQPVKEAVALAHSHGVLFHCDAAQAGGRWALDVFNLDVDALSLSAHKMHGPPGVGALFLSAANPFRPQPIIRGGGQEAGVRPGTAPTPLIAAFGEAARLTLARRHDDRVHLRAVADAFLAGLEAAQVRYQLHGAPEHRMPGCLSIAFLDHDAQDLTERLSESIYVSTGSACSSGRPTISPVLVAMNLSAEVARSTLRICFTRYSTKAEAKVAAAGFAAAIAGDRIATGRLVQ